GGEGAWRPDGAGGETLPLPGRHAASAPGSVDPPPVGHPLTTGPQGQHANSEHDELAFFFGENMLGVSTITRTAAPAPLLARDFVDAEDLYNYSMGCV